MSCTTLGRALGLLACLLAAASCSRSLPFNFTFETTHAGDLAVADGDLAPPDLGIGDLGHALDAGADDLAILTDDLATSTDLRTTKDLTTLPDLTPVSLLGAACNPSDFVPCGILGQLECMTFFKNQSNEETTAITGGYCTRSCERDEDCTAIKGLCRMMGGSGLKCMPACDGSCARDNYSCCFYCPSGPSCMAGAVCAPPAVPDYNSCIVGGNP